MVVWSLKITMFRRSHKLDTPNEKIIPQMMSEIDALCEVQLILSQSKRFAL